jgi:hypothetical protein
LDVGVKLGAACFVEKTIAVSGKKYPVNGGYASAADGRRVRIFILAKWII